MKKSTSKKHSLRLFLFYSDILLIFMILIFFLVSLHNYNSLITSHQIDDQKLLADKITNVIHDELTNNIQTLKLLYSDQNNKIATRFGLKNNFQAIITASPKFILKDILYPNSLEFMKQIDLSGLQIANFKDYPLFKGAYVIPVSSSIINGTFTFTIIINLFDRILIAELDPNLFFKAINESLSHSDNIIYFYQSGSDMIIARNNEEFYSSELYPGINNKKIKINNVNYFYSRSEISGINLDCALLTKTKYYSIYKSIAYGNIATLISLIIISIIFRIYLMNKFNYQPMKDLIDSIESDSKKVVSLNSSFYEWNTLENKFNHFINNNNKFTAKLIKEIKEKEEAKNSLDNIKTHLSEILDTLPTAIIVINPKKQISVINKTAIDYFSIPITNNEQKDIDITIPYFKKYLALIMSTINLGEKHHLSKELFKSTGLLRYVEIQILPIQFGSKLGAVISISDISTQTRLHEAIMKSERDLSLGGLLSGLAHEINNPLASIIVACQNLERRINPEFLKNIEIANKLDINIEQVNEYLEIRNIPRIISNIYNASNQTYELIKRFSLYSKKEISKKQTNIYNLIESTISLISSDHKIRNMKFFNDIQLITECNENELLLTVNEMEFKQMLFNIIKNSYEAIDKKIYEKGISPYIKITTIKDNNFVILEIEDNGVGIQEKKLHRIFDPFFSLSSNPDNLGLGLATTKYIVTEKHNGLIDFISQAGLGTKVRIKLPDEIPAID